MVALNGRQRVIITNISPRVENGKYMAKAVINEDVCISADIFGDGHDELNASVLIKQKKDRTWKEFAMTFINNDHWKIYIQTNTGRHLPILCKGMG
jgi:starch synthase (maltosyl-transferring)